MTSSDQSPLDENSPLNPQTESGSNQPIRHDSELPEEEEFESVKILKRRNILVSRSGPLPSPADFGKYEAVLPGAAERIMSMAENEQKIRADAQAGRIANEWRRINRATLLGVLLGISLIVVAGLATWLGDPRIALPLGLAGVIATLIRQFLDWYGPRRNGG